MAACARRETLEETGLAVEPGRIAFVLETRGPRSDLHTVDLVFLANQSAPGQQRRSLEPDLTARFVPLGLLERARPAPADSRGTCVACTADAPYARRLTWVICGDRAIATTDPRSCSSSPTGRPPVICLPDRRGPMGRSLRPKVAAMTSSAAWYQARTAKARTTQPPALVALAMLGAGADRQQRQADEDQPERPVCAEHGRAEQVAPDSP